MLLKIAVAAAADSPLGAAALTAAGRDQHRHTRKRDVNRHPCYTGSHWAKNAPQAMHAMQARANRCMLETTTDGVYSTPRDRQLKNHFRRLTPRSAEHVRWLVLLHLCRTVQSDTDCLVVVDCFDCRSSIARCKRSANDLGNHPLSASLPLASIRAAKSQLRLLSAVTRSTSSFATAILRRPQARKKAAPVHPAAPIVARNDASNAATTR